MDDSILYLLLGVGLALPWILMAFQPVMRARLLRNILKRRVGVARIVGDGRQLQLVIFDLDATSFTAGNRNYMPKAGTLFDAWNRCFYYDGGVPILDFDAVDVRPLPHASEERVLVPPETLQAIKANETSIFRSMLIAAYSALLQNNLVVPFAIGLLIFSALGALFAYNGANSAAQCVDAVHALNITKQVLAAVPVR